MEVPVSIITRIHNFTVSIARRSMSTIPQSLISVEKTYRAMINEASVDCVMSTHVAIEQIEFPEVIL